MTPQERQLIIDLFARMRALPPAEKDAEAEALIAAELRGVPDAPYLMTQTVLVQEMALQKAEERIRELEARATGTGTRGGSFLGSFLGLGTAANNDTGSARGSVPSIGTAPEPRSRPGATLPPLDETRAAPGRPPAGGSFLGTAMATAAGVAGGVLLAESIQSLMRGNEAKAAEGAAAKEQGQNEPRYQDANDNDPGVRPSEQASRHEEDEHRHHAADPGDDDLSGFDDFDGGIDV